MKGQGHEGLNWPGHGPIRESKKGWLPRTVMEYITDNRDGGTDHSVLRRIMGPAFRISCVRERRGARKQTEGKSETFFFKEGRSEEALDKERSNKNHDRKRWKSLFFL